MTVLLGAALVGGTGTLMGLMATGKLTLDTGWGRRTHALGPLTWTVDAPRELVWQQFTSNYLGRIPRDMRDSLRLIQRGSDMVVASHRSDLGLYTAETVEAVGFDEPERIRFRHLRGPVPYAVEEFRLDEIDENTTLLTYEGELGLDWWIAGELAARYAVVPVWLDTVTAHVEASIAAVTERAEARRRRAARKTPRT
ncbi:MAG: SRPBCC family protein [Acidimicrobiales bacterium]